MNSNDLPSVGSTLVGKYRLTRELGRGGMGAVFEAEHLRLGQKVAIKAMLPEIAKQPELAYRFEHEGRAAAKLRGRHTVRVLDVDTTPAGVPFLVMELLEGHSLRDELKQRGPLPIEDAVRYVREACEGVDEAHQAGIIHRDLKPANLFLSVEGGRRIVKVVDFGIAKAHDDADHDYRTATNVPLGTYRYMSPEQARSARSVDARTDVWSLGVVLYQLLAGKTPFDGEGALGVMLAVAMQAPPPLRGARPDVPEELAAVVERALSKDVAGRQPTARALADELAPFEGPRGSLLPHAPMSMPAGSWGQRGPFSGPLGTPAFGLTPAPSPSAGFAPSWAASQPDRPSAQQASNESITSPSKNHVVPIKPAGAALGASSPWLLRVTAALFVGGALTTGFVAWRPLTSVAPLTPAAQSEPATTPVAAAPAPPPNAAATLPAQATASISAAKLSPVLAPIEDGAEKAPAPGGEGGTKAPAIAASASAPRAGARPPQSKPPSSKPASEPAPRPVTSAATKPAEPKERTDIDRFD
jgi:eukaryotic-like serine/threonine-protein kinase